MTVYRKAFFLAASLSALLWAGCIKETPDCRVNGHSLFFYYPADGSVDVFGTYIDHVTLFVYDSEGQEVLSENIPQASLGAYQGRASFDYDLPDGTYTVVCWGNVAEYTAFTEVEDIGRGRARQSQYAAGETVSDFDSLYFGRRTITISSQEERTDTLEFVSAHINMEIHLSGYVLTPLQRATGQGIIGLENVPAGYDFDMNTTGEVTDMYPIWNDDTEQVISSRFRVFRFPDDTDIVVYIYDTDGSLRAEVALADFLAENDISVEDINEIAVPIYIRFDENGFYVTIEGWETIPTTPL